MLGLLGLVALQIQRQQPFQDFFVRHAGGVVSPAVSGSYRLIKLCMGHGEPGGALVVEVGERAFLQRLALAVYGLTFNRV